MVTGLEVDTDKEDAELLQGEVPAAQDGLPQALMPSAAELGEHDRDVVCPSEGDVLDKRGRLGGRAGGLDLLSGRPRGKEVDQAAADA